jgi:hypothetical protein
MKKFDRNRTMHQQNSIGKKSVEKASRGKVQPRKDSVVKKFSDEIVQPLNFDAQV